MKRAILFFMLFMLSMSFASAALNDSEAYWSFDNVLTDSSGNGYTLTNNGASSTANGKIDQAYSYDGTNDYMVTSSTIQPSNTVTYAAWINVTDINMAEGKVIDNDGAGFTGTFIDIVSGDIRAIYNGNQVLTYSGGTSNTWHHVVTTYDGVTIRLYVDGVQRDSQAYSSAISYTGSNIVVGARSSTSAGYFEGVIDEVGIWSRALSSSEITDLYNAGAGLNPYAPVTTGNFTITASDSYTTSALSSFNATVDWNGTTTQYSTNTSSIITTIPVNSGLANVTVTANNYFSNSTLGHDTTTNLQQTITPYTRIEAFDLVNNNYLNNFTVTYNSTDYNTTTGNVSIALFNETATITVSSLNYANSEFNITANPYLENSTAYLYTNNSLNIFVKKTIDDTLLTEFTEILILSTDLTVSENLTTNNGTAYIDLLAPLTYTATFSSENYSTRSYSFTVADSTNRELTAYLSTNTSNILFNVQDTLGNTLSGSTISIFENVGGNVVGVATALSDAFGQATINLDTSTEYLITVSNTDYNDFNGFFTPTTNTYTISLEPATSSVYVSPVSDTRFNVTESYDNNTQSIYIEYEVYSPSGSLESFQIATSYNNTNYINITTTSVTGGLLTLSIPNVNLTTQNCINITYAFDNDGFDTVSETYNRCFTDVQPSDITLSNVFSVIQGGTILRLIIATIMLLIIIVSSLTFSRNPSLTGIIASLTIGVLTNFGLYPEPGGWVASILIFVLVIANEVSKR